MKQAKTIAGINITNDLLVEILETPEGGVLTPIPYLVFPINGDIGMTWEVHKKLPDRIVLSSTTECWDCYEMEWYEIDGFFFEIRPKDFGLKKF